jgi:hypothetical protein
MRIPALLLTAVFAVGMLTGIHAPQAAENVCKGLANAACLGNGGCSWVKPYKAKSGKEVAGFCRRKPTRQTKSKEGGRS